MDVGPDTKVFSIIPAGDGASPTGAASSTEGGGGGAAQVVNAPMDGEGVYMSFFKAVGDSVAKNDVVVEVESDKATIEIKSPIDGTISEFFVPEQEEMDVGPDTKVFSVTPAGGGAAPTAAAGGAVTVVNAPMDGEGVYMSFFKAVG